MRLEEQPRESTYIIIGSGHEWEIKRQLINLGFPHLIFPSQLAMRRNLEYEKLIFPTRQNPEVSVLLTTAYNNWNIVYNCLKSLLENENECSIEIILGWNCPPDNGIMARKYLDGVRIICHSENRNYLGNLNAIAKEASGEYLLLLSDDTLFTKKHYIDTVLSLIKRDKKIGMASGKLWVPYKRKYDTHSVYTTPTTCKEVELKQETEVENMWPVAAVIRRSLWEEIRGLDPIYLPVYYEDVDFEMKLLSKGYSMVATPDAEMIHYGGGTYKMGGKDPKVIRNQKIFLSRWEEYIKKRIEQRSESMICH